MIGFCVWFTGLPGSGKSTLAARVRDLLAERGHEVILWQMDVRRRVYVSNPTYSDEERDQSYIRFVEEARDMAERGKGVILDATGHSLAWRRYARETIARFAEVHVACPVELAMEREAARPQGMVMAGMYRKALERKRTGKQVQGLGPVIGVDLAFETDPQAECVVDNTGPEPEIAVRSALDCVLDWLKRTAA